MFSNLEFRSGPYFIPDYTKGSKCWEKGCDYAESQALCRENHGSIATINNAHENRMIGELLNIFGVFNPKSCEKDYFWFYIGLREQKLSGGLSHYMWESGSNSTFKNW